MANPIRVLHVIRLMNHGGVESMIMNLYRNIDRTKVQFDFVQNSNETAVYDEEILALGGRIYHCPHYNGKNHFVYTRWWHEFFRTHPSEHPIVHGHLGSTAAIYLAIAKKYGCYAIAHSHSAGKGSRGFRVFSFPTRYIANYFFACSTDAAVARYGKCVAGDGSRCQILNNAIDTARFAYCAESNNRLRSELGIPVDAPVVGHLGRFRAEKNHMFLLEVFQQIHAVCPESVLLLVGDGELRPEIEQKSRELELEACVILAGARSNTWDYYSVMNVFVMPSMFEGVPVSLVEAQASGLHCIVSSNVPQDAAVTELVRFLPLEGGIPLWAEVVRQAASAPRFDMTARLREVGYDIAETAKWLEEFYRKAVNNE